MNSALPALQKPLNETPSCSYTLSSKYYLDAEIFEREKEKIFYRTWQYVTPVAALPEVGDYVTLTICDESIFVIRSRDGCLRAFYNVCRHRAHLLLKGSGNRRNAIVCPYHAWSYHSDGRLLRAPMSHGRDGFDASEFGLKAIRLEEFCGCVFVNLDDQADSLQSLAGALEQDIQSRIPRLDELHLCGSNLYGETRIAAGWKVVVDNYVECYHCTPAHPDFASLIDMNAYQVDVFDHWSRQLGPRIRNDNSAYPVDPNEACQESAFWYLWPNTTFGILPGSLEFAVYAIRPIDMESCQFEGEILNVDKGNNQARADYTANVLTPEDISLCESVQRGLKSKSYQQGPFIVDADQMGISEHALHHFHRLVHDALGQ